MKARLYGTDWCGYCARAKALLEKSGIEVEELLVGEDVSLDDVSQQIGKRVTTVPQVFLDDEYVGGYTELAERLKAA